MAEENQNNQDRPDPQEEIKKGEDAIEKIVNNETDIYFFTLDTQGNPTAGVANIYEMVRILTDKGYKAHIMHEKDDYHGVQDWLGEEYMELSHVSAEGGQLNIGPEDVLVIPEVFATIMKQVKDLPCKKVVLCQSYYYLTETLPIGDKWNGLGFHDVITTSEKQAQYLKELFPHVNTHIVPVSIPDFFKPPKKLKEPTISIHTRDQAETMRIVKTFYLQFPQYKWVPFQDMRGYPRKNFADLLSRSALAVWVDDIAGFGTFPIEAMETDTPVIGKVPEMIPEWMLTTDEEGNEKIAGNGIWTNSKIAIPELIAKYMKLWFEDQHPQELFDEMEKMKGVYTLENQEKRTEEVFHRLLADKKDFIEKEMQGIKDNMQQKPQE